MTDQKVRHFEVGVTGRVMARFLVSPRLKSPHLNSGRTEVITYSLVDVDEVLADDAGHLADAVCV